MTDLGPLFGGIAGLLQLSLLPGMLLLPVLARRGIAIPGSDAPLLVFTCSLVLSFVVLLLLHTLGLHTRTAWLLLGLLQVAAWLLLTFTHKPALTGVLPPATPLQLLQALFAFAYLLYCLSFALELVGRWPAPFEEWDAVINWNRWALDWTRGAWPEQTWGYPQLLPAAWSIVYLWQGSTEIEFLLRAWLGLFPLGLAWLCFSMFLHWRRIAPLLAGVALLALLGSSFAPVLDSGYADVPLTFFTLLTGHWVLRAGRPEQQAWRWLACACLAAAAALLTKQGGVLALALLLWGMWCHRSHTGLLFRVVLLLGALVLPWYGLQWLHGTGGDVSLYVTEAIYGGETRLQRLGRALGTSFPALLFPGMNAAVTKALTGLMVLAVVASLREARGRFCAATGTAWLLLWALYFSYDGRNLLPGLPFLLLAAAIGLEQLGQLAKVRLPLLALRPLPRLRLPARTGPILVLLVLVAALLPGNPAPWESLTNDLRKASGDPALNLQLIEYVNTPGFNGTIYTTYPQVASIRELRSHLFVDFGATHMQAETIAALRDGRPFCEILATFPRPETVSHLLLHVSVYPPLVDAALAEGSLQLRLATPEQRLLQVQCPPPGQPKQREEYP
jgi:hypothetical protein